MLEFRTLGSIDLQDDDGRSIDSVVLHPKSLSLLAYLCISNPPRRHRRDSLLGLFWPERDDAHARGALRQELHRLRRALGSGVVLGDWADAVGVDFGVLRCDAQQFEAALDDGRAADALTLWQGELLPGLHVEGCEFERWLDETRERLSHRAAEAVRRLMIEAEDAADGAAVLSWARRLTELAPYDESGWQRLILLLDRQGDRAGALRAYDSMAVRLRTGLEVEPSPETRALVKRIRSREEAFVGAVNGLSEVGADPLRTPAQPPSRPVIGLLPVENRTGDVALDGVASRVTDRIAQGLAGAVFVDVALGRTAPDVVAVVSATLYRRGELLEVVTRLAEPGEGGRLVDMPRAVTLTCDAPDDRLDLLTAHVLASVVAHYDPRFDAAATREHALPMPTPLWEACLEYIQGSELFGQFHFEEGYRHLLRAYEIDPGFLKAAGFAAIALAATGQPAAAETLLAKALTSGHPVSEYDRTLGGWFLADLRGRRVEAYRFAVESTHITSHPVAVYIAAREAVRMNRPREALRLLEGINFWQGWWRNWTDYIETVAGAHHMLRNHRAELAAALEGRARFPGSLGPIRAEVRARAALREPARVLALVNEALTLPAGLTSPASVAWVAAQEFTSHGDEPSAARSRGTALEWLADRAEPSLAEQQLRVRLLLETGDPTGAASALTTLDSSEDLESLELAGLVAAQQDHAASARQALAALEALENPYLSGRHLLMAAGIQAVLDSPEVAIATLRRALAAGLPFGVELHALPILQPVAGRSEFRALLRPRG